MITFLTIVFILVSALLVLVILMQRGRGGGLAGAFGSGGGGNSAFGTKIGDVFTTVTVVLFVIFLLLSVGLNYAFQGHKETIGVGAPATAPAALDVQAPGTPAAAGGAAPATGPESGK